MLIKRLFIIVIMLSPFIFLESHAIKTCIQKTYRGPDNLMVCVCNSTYCDELPPIPTLAQDQAAVYTSSQSGKRFDLTFQSFESNNVPTSIQITIDPSKTYQKIIGFGGAFTDSMAYNLFNLNVGAQQNLIQAYYGDQGIGYTIGRVLMANCDFSWRGSSHGGYSYDDVEGDFNLTHFSLVNEDLNFKIPAIKMARALVGSKFKLFSSVWGAPYWMKTNGFFYAHYPLKGDPSGPYFHTWANYFVKFFEDYAKQDVNFWGLTVQNEPDVGWLSYNASTERDFVKLQLGPALKNNPLTQNLTLMILDTNKENLPRFADTVLSDPDAARYVDGIGIHWYNDISSGLSNTNEDWSTLDRTHESYPDRFMLYTEACISKAGVSPGNWSRADAYAHDVIQVLNHWVTGFIDWNLCLDMNGGPNWVDNFVDAPILVDAVNDEFYKNPMFYALGHFSKFLVEDSVRIGLDVQGTTNKNLEMTVFMTPTNEIVLVVNNRDVCENYSVVIKEAGQDKTLKLQFEARSITTVLWKKH